MKIVYRFIIWLFSILFAAIFGAAYGYAKSDDIIRFATQKKIARKKAKEIDDEDKKDETIEMGFH